MRAPPETLRFCNGQTKSRGARDSSWSNWVLAGDRASESGVICYRGYSRRRGWTRRRGCCRAPSARRWCPAAGLTPARRSPGRWASCPSGSWCSGGRSCRIARAPAHTHTHVVVSSILRSSCWILLWDGGKTFVTGNIFKYIT